MAAKRIQERFAFSGTVGDGDNAHVIEGVLLCGATSANRRRYTAEAFAGGRVERYNGKPVFLNHGSGRGGRAYQDQIGTVENARLNADGLPVGDIAVNPKKPFAEAVLWDAQHKPKACGMSHVAQCETRRGKDGWEEITEIVSVESVDLVTDPATTKGFREHKGSTVPTTIREFSETFARMPKATTEQILRVKRLAEMDGMGDLPMDAPPEDADPNDAITAGFKAAIDAIVAQVLDGSLDWKSARKKCDKIFDSHKDATSTGTAEPEAETETEEEPSKESKVTKPDFATVLKEFKDAGIAEPDTADIALLLEVADPAKRAIFVTERRRKAAEAKAEKPKSGATRRTTATEQKQPAKDVNEFLSRVYR